MFMKIWKFDSTIYCGSSVQYIAVQYTFMLKFRYKCELLYQVLNNVLSFQDFLHRCFLCSEFRIMRRWVILQSKVTVYSIQCHTITDKNRLVFSGASLGQGTYSGIFPVIITFNANYDRELLDRRTTKYNAHCGWIEWKWKDSLVRRSSLFLDVAQHRLVINYRLIGTT